MKNLLSSIAIALSIVAVVFTFNASHKSVSLGAANAPTILKTASNTNASVLITSTAIVAKNTARLHLVIINDSSNIIYLGIGTAAVANKGIRLNANGGSYEMNDQNLDVQAVNGIAVGGTSNVTVLEE
jgi:hypothetical protein